MDPSEAPPPGSTLATIGYSASESSSDNYAAVTAPQPGERSESGEAQIQGDSTSSSSLSPPLSPSLAPSLVPSFGTAGFRQLKREVDDRKRFERRDRRKKAKAMAITLDDSDYAEFRSAVGDWFVHKKPPQFPSVLFNVLDKLGEARRKWLQENPDQISEVLVEAWVSPQPNESPVYKSSNGVGLWKWLNHVSESTKAGQQIRDNKFILISLTGLTSDILKALLIHYKIQIGSLYEMIYIDNFSSYIYPASENVFALRFDFVRLTGVGVERRFHTQAFTEFENTRRNHILSWKWDPLGSEPEESDRAFGISRAVVWINRDRRTGETVAIFYTEPKKSKQLRGHTLAQWNMSRFCDDPHLRSRSSLPIEESGSEPFGEIFSFLARYFKEAFKWSRVLALHYQKISALEEEAFHMPMVETTRDLYRERAALDIHLSLLSLQKTMISALRTRQVSESMFWPRDAALLFGDIEDNLGEKIVEFERMRKQCDDIHNLIFNIISIEESRAAVDQGRSVGRLTWLTFIFLPLSFGASILGMNVFQLNSPGLWLYFALAIPLFIAVTGGILLLKASVLYSQSGHEQMGFVKWIISGRPMRSKLNRADLERGNLKIKLLARLGKNAWKARASDNRRNQLREQTEHAHRRGEDGMERGEVREQGDLLNSKGEKKD